VEGKVAFVTGGARGQGRSHAIPLAQEGADIVALDIVVVSARRAGYGPAHDPEDQTWRDMLDVNSTGVWHTAKVAIPNLIEQRGGGSIVITNSARGLTARPNLAH
jgi:NAD(P)-dependent dehydrogenase (short-subunit alcohol dehydrogenase family)